MKPSYRFVFGIISGIVCTMASVAETKVIVVSQDVQEEFLTLSAALEASSEGDTIRVLEGEYEEALALKKNQLLVEEGNVVLSNPEGTTITTSSVNEIRNITIIDSGLYAITGNDVESLVIENVEIREFNTLKQIARNNDPYGYETTYEAIYLESSGSVDSTINLTNIEILNGYGGGINIASKGASTLICQFHEIEIQKIDASTFISHPSSFPGSPGFPALFLLSADQSIINASVENMDVQEVGDSGDGILAQANDSSTLHLDVYRFRYNDPTDISGQITQGIEFASGSSNTTVYAKIEESDILNSNRSAIGNFNWFGEIQGVIDLGGGELGSRGLNRFIGNAFHFDGASPLPISAENNYWGNSDGAVDIHIWQGTFDIDNIPYLENDPRPMTSGIDRSMWQIYE